MLYLSVEKKRSAAAKVNQNGPGTLHAVSRVIPRYMTVAAINDLRGDALPTSNMGRASKEIGTIEIIQKSAVRIDVNMLYPLVCLFVCCMDYVLLYIVKRFFTHQTGQSFDNFLFLRREKNRSNHTM